jgi:hypothetical protein
MKYLLPIDIGRKILKDGYKFTQITLRVDIDKDYIFINEITNEYMILFDGQYNRLTKHEVKRIAERYNLQPKK